MHFHIITLFPDFFEGPLTTGVLGTAIEQKLVQVSFYHLIDYKEAPNKRVDDVPYGGGAGMVIRPEVIALAIEDVRKKTGKNLPVIHFSPRGKKLTQSRIEQLHPSLSECILLCGRYEGIDQRALDMFVTHEFCVGDVILSGGEFPALFFIDSLARLVPGVLGNDESHQEESFSKELGRKKEYPHYTRPEEWRGQKVPEVLISGHHANIKKWRREQLS